MAHFPRVVTALLQALVLRSMLATKVLSRSDEASGRTDTNTPRAAHTIGPLSKQSEDEDVLLQVVMVSSTMSKTLSDLVAERSKICAHRSFESSDTIGYSAWTSANWGNLLSEYFEPFALAALSGKQFSSGQIDDSWLRYLPQKGPAHLELKDMQAVQAACDDCAGTPYTHECAGGWVRVRGLIQDAVQDALQQYADLNPDEVRFESSSKEVLFHMRLEFAHSQVQWPGLSFFKGKIPSDATKVTIVHMPYTEEQIRSVGGHIHQEFPQEMQTSITEVLNAYKNMLRPLCGGCLVETSFSSQYGDFARIAHHQGVVFCMGSSYCLWAAFANIHGPVYMARNFGGGKSPAVNGGKGAGFFWNDGQSLPSEEIRNFELMTPGDLIQWIQTH
eukprot:TRINITY_DN17097_c1_g1_i3.p1 TRINITY_DN17097_c1_g1~~TRINITY_DN17097_c1_g1_i3.p1  ORF type:complete len:409 (+),score=41.13 TRINITY_DN17097_c1_g1_i3:61-1227(+)